MIGFEVKRMFFDSKTVRQKTDKATRRVLSRFGAFVRQTAKRSIRKRKKISAQGQTPSSHTGLLRRFILYAYQQARRSVIIGPKRLGSKRGQAPSALEYGGRSATSERQSRTIKIRPRPYMGPAFEKEKPQLGRLWRDSIK